jgi:hypothetical protein
MVYNEKRIDILKIVIKKTNITNKKEKKSITNQSYDSKIEINKKRIGVLK